MKKIKPLLSLAEDRIARPVYSGQWNNLEKLKQLRLIMGNAIN